MGGRFRFLGDIWKACYANPKILGDFFNLLRKSPDLGGIIEFSSPPTVGGEITPMFRDSSIEFKMSKFVWNRIQRYEI